MTLASSMSSLAPPNRRRSKAVLGRKAATGAPATSRARPPSINTAPPSANDRVASAKNGFPALAVHCRREVLVGCGPEHGGNKCTDFMVVERLEVDRRPRPSSAMRSKSCSTSAADSDPGRKVATVSMPTSARRATSAVRASDSRSATCRSSSTRTAGPASQPSEEADGTGEDGTEVVLVEAGPAVPASIAWRNARPGRRARRGHLPR